MADVVASFDMEEIPRGKKFFETFEPYRKTNDAYGEASPLAFDYYRQKLNPNQALPGPMSPTPPPPDRKSAHLDLRDAGSDLGDWSKYVINNGKPSNGQYDHFYEKLHQFSMKL